MRLSFVVITMVTYQSIPNRTRQGGAVSEFVVMIIGLVLIAVGLERWLRVK